MWYYTWETGVFFFIGYLSFCPLLQYLVGHIFNHIEAIRNTNAWKFTGPRKSLMAWGTWEEISFSLGSETWDDRSLTDTRRHFRGGHRFRRVGGACRSLPVDLAVLPALPPASSCCVLVLQSVNVLTHQNTSQGKRRSYRKLWEQGWRGRKKKWLENSPSKLCQSNEQL